MKSNQHGLTLMELMVVMVIVGILAAIAYPSYRDQVLRSNRTEAKVELERTTQALEKCFTRFMRYNSAAVGDCVAYDQAVAGYLTEGGRYRVTIEFPRADAGAPAQSYRLTATPQAGQVADARCLNLSINEIGEKAASGPGGRAACW